MTPNEVVPDTVKVFVSERFAVVLSTRAELDRDDDIIVSILVQENESWYHFGVATHDFHSYWIHTIQELLREAHAWLIDNADPSPNEDGVQYGWKVRKSVATELEWLKWFAQNADFGPAEGDIRNAMRKEFRKLTGKEIPKGWRGED